MSGKTILFLISLMIISVNYLDDGKMEFFSYDGSQIRHYLTESFYCGGYKIIEDGKHTFTRFCNPDDVNWDSFVKKGAGGGK